MVNKNKAIVYSSQKKEAIAFSRCLYIDSQRSWQKIKPAEAGFARGRG